nr:hypothetical protein [Brevibacillus laterosporus]
MDAITRSGWQSFDFYPYQCSGLDRLSEGVAIPKANRNDHQVR